MTDLLTDAEHKAVTVAGLLAELVADIIVDGPSAPGDTTEAIHHIHAVQRMILAQAAARAYPDRYRLLGDTVKVAPPTWWSRPATTDPELPLAAQIANDYRAGMRERDL